MLLMIRCIGFLISEKERDMQGANQEFFLWGVLYVKKKIKEILWGPYVKMHKDFPNPTGFSEIFGVARSLSSAGDEDMAYF